MVAVEQQIIRRPSQDASQIAAVGKTALGFVEGSAFRTITAATMTANADLATLVGIDSCPVFHHFGRPNLDDIARHVGLYHITVGGDEDRPTDPRAVTKPAA